MKWSRPLDTETTFYINIVKFVGRGWPWIKGLKDEIDPIFWNLGLS